MKTRYTSALVTATAILMASSAAYAGCTGAQISGVWEAAFSDGNSCRFKINANGNIAAAKSVCFDPSAGSIAPDSGSLVVSGNCLAEGSFTVLGATIELAIQFATDRNTGGGRYLYQVGGEKGNVIMIRVP